MAPQNYATVLKEKQAPAMVVEQVPYNKPEANELVIKNMAVAINPADWIIQKMGILVQNYPAILGCDVAGIVEEVGSDIRSIAVGDHVVGMATCLETPNGVFKYAGFQQYPVLRWPQVVKIPKDVDFTHGVVIPLGVLASSSCLFMQSCLGLSIPPSQQGKGKTLLVWGASSSVGSCGIQLARAAGYEIVGIASRQNHDFVKLLGAVECFDQKDENVVEDIVGYLRGKTVVGACQAVASPEAVRQICEILDKVNGRKVIGTVIPGSEAHAILGVKVAVNVSDPLGAQAILEPVWQGYLQPALAAGKFQYKPDPEVVGHGLQSIQKGCDIQSQGVSAKKIVVTLQ